MKVKHLVIIVCGVLFMDKLDRMLRWERLRGKLELLDMMTQLEIERRGRK